MAKYDYYCLACEHAEEVSRSMGEDEPAGGHPCPRCGYRMVRQWTLPAIQFKGPGFYSTDNRYG